jgi:RNA polymerase sigma-70 factor (ECF subfamily)
MASPEHNFESPNMHLEKEEKGKPLSPEERLKLVQKYLTPEGKGNDLFAERCIIYFTPIVTRMIGEKYFNYVEDVVQIATFKASRCLSQFAGDASLQTYLFRICYNEILTFFRYVKVRKDYGPQADSLEDVLSTGEDIVSPATEAEALNSAEILESLLSTLDEYQKHLITLHYVEGYSIEEMAEMLHTNENTLKVQLFRARQTMIKYAGRKGLKIVR